MDSYKFSSKSVSGRFPLKQPLKQPIKQTIKQTIWSSVSQGFSALTTASPICTVPTLVVPAE